MGGFGGLPLCGPVGLAARLDCPAVCTSCFLGVCHIDCDEKEECEGAVLSCPDGLDCALHCSGEVSCRQAIVTCPLSGEGS